MVQEFWYRLPTCTSIVQHRAELGTGVASRHHLKARKTAAHRHALTGLLMALHVSHKAKIHVIPALGILYQPLPMHATEGGIILDVPSRRRSPEVQHWLPLLPPKHLQQPRWDNVAYHRGQEDENE